MIFMDVTDLFPTCNLFADTTGDGYPDDLGLMVQVPTQLSDPHIWAGLLNVIARLAFGVTSLDLPLTRYQNTRTIQSRAVLWITNPIKDPVGKLPKTPPAQWIRQRSDRVYLTGASGSAMGAALNALAQGCGMPTCRLPSEWAVIDCFPGERIDTRDAAGRILASQPHCFSGSAGRVSSVVQAPLSDFDLLDPCGPRGWYRTDAAQPRSKQLALAIQLPANRPLPASLGHALAEVAALAALEATQLHLPMADIGRAPADAVVLDVREQLSPTAHIRIQSGSPVQSVRLLATGSNWSLGQLLKKWIRTFCRPDGPDSEAANIVRQALPDIAGCLSGQTEMGKWAHALAAGCRLPTSVNTRGLHMQLKSACQALGKKEPPRAPKSQPFVCHWRHPGEAVELLRNLQSIPPGQGRLEGALFVSKSDSDRLHIHEQCRRVLIQKGYEPHIWVCNAYKPGLCWLLEVVLPEIQSVGTVNRVEIAYQPFAPADVQALEMSSRWLQELFPGPDLLMERLNLFSENVTIVQQADLTAIYRVRGYDPAGQCRLERHFSPLYSSFPYVARRPELGWVHPTCGGIQLRLAGLPFILRNIPTDRERFWHVFQNRWLPAWETHMLKRLNNVSAQGSLVFWDRMEIDVYIAETDQPLDFAHEHIRPMEALHEDLYFVLLEAFSDFVARHGLPETVRLGQIIPRVFARTKNGKTSARLRAWPKVTDPPAPESIRPTDPPLLMGLSRASRQWVAEMAHDLNQHDAAHAEALGKIMVAWGYAVAKHGERCHVRIRSQKLNMGHKASCHKVAGEWRSDRLIDAQTAQACLARLSQTERLHVWPIARSYQHRSIMALEAITAGRGAWISIAKLRLLKPTLMINARHHANEVSGTSACLDLAEYLTAQPEGRAVLQQTNVVMIPLENVDGVALFDRLWPDFKGHKLHAARYNALGAEFYADYHRNQPDADEAQAKKRLWQRWLPQAMIDQHGVPHHEWDQPFSGYAPFRFREFWIPRTFIYVYVPFIAEPDHPGFSHAQSLADRLGRNMARNRSIVELNRMMAARYQRYAYHWAPDIFPPSNGEPLLALPFADRVYPYNFAKRYPEITRTELIVEAPDEVADGRALELCVTANRIIQDTVLQELKRSVGKMTCQKAADGRNCLAWQPGK